MPLRLSGASAGSCSKMGAREHRSGVAYLPTADRVEPCTARLTGGGRIGPARQVAIDVRADPPRKRMS